MKKALAFIISLSLIFMLAITPAYASEKGFNSDGNNSTARLYNGFYSQDLHLTMKWSKDWTPMANEPLGAWCTNHYTWYSNDYSNSNYGYDTMTAYGEGTYRIEEFLKIMKVSDDADTWAKYEASGAYDALWGEYPDGVPMYVVFQDSISVYSAASGELIYSTEFVNRVNKGLGKPIF